MWNLDSSKWAVQFSGWRSWLISNMVVMLFVGMAPRLPTAAIVIGLRNVSAIMALSLWGFGHQVDFDDFAVRISLLPSFIHSNEVLFVVLWMCLCDHYSNDIIKVITVILHMVLTCLIASSLHHESLNFVIWLCVCCRLVHTDSVLVL